MNQKLILTFFVFALLVGSVVAVTLTRDATERVVVPVVARGEVCLLDETDSCVGPNQEIVFGNADIYATNGDIITLLLVVFDDNVYRSTSTAVVYAEDAVAGGECCDFSDRYSLFEGGACTTLGFEEVASSFCPSPPAGASGLACCNVAGSHYEYSPSGCEATWGASPAVESVDLSFCDVQESGPLGLFGQLSRVLPDGNEVYTTGDVITYTDEGKVPVTTEEPVGRYYISYNNLEFINTETERRMIIDDYENLEFTLNYAGDESRKYRLQTFSTSFEPVEWAAGCSTDADCDEGEICDEGGCKTIPV